MAGKRKQKKGAGASRAQQQQQAAARRSVVAARPGRADDSAPDRAVAPAVSAPGQEQSAPARHYLDVAAVHIQDWLGRTPDLKFRRGASVLLSKATSPDAWEGKLPAGMAWNPEAGSVDGVVSLVLDDPADIDLAEPAQTQLAEAAHSVVASMRATMPHCPIQAVAGKGDSYAAAYPAMDLARRDGNFLIDSPPAPPELFLAKPCDQCRSAAATKPNVEVASDEDPVALCDECNARFANGGGTAGRPSQAPLPERRLRKALEAEGMHVKDFSDTFADMAAAGQRDRDDAPTQLALIYADGNKVGAFLSTLANTPGGPDKAEIAPLLDRATLGALVRAVLDRFKGWPKPPVLVNLAGGDDLLVSVPAIDAWLFTKTLLASFTALITSEADGWPADTRKSIPTLAAGLVFHHAKTPFSDVVRLADKQLRVAKAKTRGKHAAVAFLDITADGNQPPEGREPVTLDYLERHQKRLQETTDLPKSRRQTLLDLYRHGDTDGFIARLTDFGNRPLWEIAAGPGADAPAVRTVLAGNRDRQDEVRRALDIARHWHAEPRNPESEAAQ